MNQHAVIYTSKLCPSYLIYVCLQEVHQTHFSKLTAIFIQNSIIKGMNNNNNFNFRRDHQKKFPMSVATMSR